MPQTMIPSFILNLDRNAERLRFMQAQFGALGLEFTRVHGIDGQTLDRSRSRAAPYALLSAGEIGCFESHRKAWQAVVDQDLPAGIVLEDDVAIADDYGELTFEMDFLETIDLIKIDTHPRPSIQGEKERGAIPGRILRRMLGSENSASGYVITARGARRLLKQSENYIMPVDLFLFNLDSPAFIRSVIWKLCPAAVSQLKFQPDKGELHIEFQDGIQARRRSEVEPRPGATVWNRWRLRLHRLSYGNLKPLRSIRLRRFLAGVTPNQGTVNQAVPYHTGGHTHTNAGIAAMGNRQ